MAQQTRLWGYGGPGHLYGSFAGKSSAAAPTKRTTVSVQPGFYVEDQGHIDIRFPFNNKVRIWLPAFLFSH